jgi:hypothetical protein
MLCPSLFAQHTSQPEKESTTDLRSGLVMFSVEDVKEETIYWLERTANYDYFLRMKEDDDEKILKVGSKDALKLDREFASKFLKAQYEIESVTGDCKVTLRLSLKGEGQDLCKKDDKKTQEFLPFIKSLAQRF